MNDSLIGEHMVSAVHKISPEYSVENALKEMKRLKIRHFPVLNKGRLVGVVSERDLKSAVSLLPKMPLTVGDVMARDVYVVSASTALSEVAAYMASEKLGSAVIVNRNNHVVGIFTTTDALRILAKSGDDASIESYLNGSEEYIAINDSDIDPMLIHGYAES